MVQSNKNGDLSITSISTSILGYVPISSLKPNVTKFMSSPSVSSKSSVASSIRSSWLTTAYVCTDMVVLPKAPIFSTAESIQLCYTNQYGVVVIVGVVVVVGMVNFFSFDVTIGFLTPR